MWKLSLIMLSLHLVGIHGASVQRAPTKVLLKDKSWPSTNDQKSVEFDESWECGGEDFSKLISQQMISNDCPQLLYQVNHCCVEHDDCYDKQRGQVHCDQVFCSCLSTVTYSPDNSTEVCHQEHSPYFCNMVQEFGDSFYDAAGPKSDQSEKKTKPALVEVPPNSTSSGPVRIHESRTFEAAHAIQSLPELDLFD